MGLYAGSGGVNRITSATFRSTAAVSCVPGQHSGSGGLFIADVERVFGRYDVPIDYGRDPGSNFPRRWPTTELAARLTAGQGAVLLGDYDALPSKYRASGTFLGDHSVWVHRPRFVGGVLVDLCWHDPLRTASIRVPMWAALAYWQKPSGTVSGFAGFVADKAAVPGDDDMLKYEILEDVSGAVRVKGAGHSIVYFDDRRVPIAASAAKGTTAKIRLHEPLDAHAGDRRTAYLVNHGGEAGFLLAADVTVARSYLVTVDGITVRVLVP
jgi:hypothetical protein